MGIIQTEFLDKVLYFHFENLEIKNFISLGFDLVLAKTDRNTLTEDLIEVFVRYLKTPDARNQCIDLCETKVSELTVEPTEKKQYSIWGSDYERNSRIEDIVTIHFYSCAALYEFERGISYYKIHGKYANGGDQEINLYCLLGLLRNFNQVDLWKKEFEAAKSRRITPRDKLKEIYKFICEKNEFPTY